MTRFLHTWRTVTLYMAVAEIREPLLRWPLFSALWLWKAPDYFWGAWRHNRLNKPEFWQFTWDMFYIAITGYWAYDR